MNVPSVGDGMDWKRWSIFQTGRLFLGKMAEDGETYEELYSLTSNTSQAPDASGNLRVSTSFRLEPALGMFPGLGPFKVQAMVAGSLVNASASEKAMVVHLLADYKKNFPNPDSRIDATTKLTEELKRFPPQQEDLLDDLNKLYAAMPRVTPQELWIAMPVPFEPLPSEEGFKWYARIPPKSPALFIRIEDIDDEE